MKANYFTPKIITESSFQFSAKQNLVSVMQPENYGYTINTYTLFINHFNDIPNYVAQSNIDCRKAMKWFNEKYQNEIKDVYYSKGNYKGCKEKEITEIHFIALDDLIVHFNAVEESFSLLFKKTPVEKVDEIYNELAKFKFKKQKHQPKINLLMNSSSGITTKAFNISKPKLNITDNYNNDFIEVHKIIHKKLSKQNEKGLVLLHGKPGTGKTSYIRYLASLLKKNIIFLPPNLASGITTPSLISILTENPNSIFVIEDAENIVIDREKTGSSAVSALLNISDGLLADCLNVQVICSFNTDLSKIDSALMRKGRLIAKYEFKELETDKAQKLSNKLGFQTTIKEPMNLTTIYNQNEKDFAERKQKSKIGFNSTTITQN